MFIDKNFVYTILVGGANSGKTSTFLVQRENVRKTIISVVDVDKLLPNAVICRNGYSSTCFNNREIYFDFINLNSLVEGNFSLHENSDILIDEIHFFNTVNLELLAKIVIEKIIPMKCCVYISLLTQSHNNTLLPNFTDVWCWANNVEIVSRKCCHCKSIDTTQSTGLCTEQDVVIGKEFFQTVCIQCKNSKPLKS